MISTVKFLKQKCADCKIQFGEKFCLLSEGNRGNLLRGNHKGIRIALISVFENEKGGI